MIWLELPLGAEMMNKMKNNTRKKKEKNIKNYEREEGRDKGKESVLIE